MFDATRFQVSDSTKTMRQMFVRNSNAYAVWLILDKGFVHIGQSVEALGLRPSFPPGFEEIDRSLASDEAEVDERPWNSKASRFGRA